MQLVEVKLRELRPTQMTVGYDEVAFKRRQWSTRTSEEKSRFIFEHPFPAVLGPDATYYILDGHHLGRALFEEEVEVVRLSLVENLSHLDLGEFWRLMNQRGLMHPHDAHGRRRDPKEMPKTVGDLADDPFRSLAAQVRRAGVYAKDPTPFAEFQWANYFRRHISFAAVRAYPERALECAKKLARDDASICGAGFGGVLKSSSLACCPSVHNGLRLCDERNASVG